jgi:glutathione S-transferase
MLTIHHLAVSQSERIVWLCEELEIPYELVRYEREPTYAAPPAFKALHPAGTAPTITDGAVTLAESGAVIEYILALYGDGRLVVAKDDPEFVNYLFWFHFAGGSMMPSALVGVVLNSLAVGEGNHFSRAVVARGDLGCSMMEARLGSVPFLAGGRFTAADLFMVFALTTMSAFAPRDLSAYPNIRAYLERISARPAYRRAMKKADPHFPRPFDAATA